MKCSREGYRISLKEQKAFDRSVLKISLQETSENYLGATPIRSAMPALQANERFPLTPGVRKQAGWNRVNYVPCTG